MDATWKNADLVSYHTFREQLLSQMLQYDPRKRHYHGDELIQISTKQHLNVWPSRKMKEKIAPNADRSVTMGQYQAAKKEGRGRECVLISISSLTITNRLLALLKIHGNATSVARICIQSVECVVKICI